MPHPLPPAHDLWPYFPTLTRIALAVALGVFVGLERERRGKEAGVRTFGVSALLGCLGSLLGEHYALLSLVLLGVLVVFINWQRLRTNDTAELTTSVALLVVGFIGVMCGLGHTFTPVAVGIVTAALLAWKEPLTEFSLGLTEQELRAAILLGILTFIIYPILPAQPIDPWGLIAPRNAWATVILIASIGFVNYILWKLYGTRGVEFSGFLGGLVNSTVAVAELSSRAHEAGERFADVAYRGILLATSAMLIRNIVLLTILERRALLTSAFSLALMFATSAALVAWSFVGQKKADVAVPTLHLHSPFSLSSALKFGAVFVTLDVGGNLAQRFLGPVGFYAVSFAGGFVSSASAVASAGTLTQHGKITAAVAGHGVILATVASMLVNLPLVIRVTQQPRLQSRLTLAVGIIIAVGLLADFAQIALFPHLGAT
jgi:uncharacterized membrane protein (DUF4010 family)